MWFVFRAALLVQNTTTYLLLTLSLGLPRGWTLQGCSGCLSQTVDVHEWRWYLMLMNDRAVSSVWPVVPLTPGVGRRGGWGLGWCWWGVISSYQLAIWNHRVAASWSVWWKNQCGVDKGRWLHPGIMGYLTVMGRFVKKKKFLPFVLCVDVSVAILSCSVEPRDVLFKHQLLRSVPRDKLANDTEMTERTWRHHCLSESSLWSNASNLWVGTQLLIIVI